MSSPRISDGGDSLTAAPTSASAGSAAIATSATTTKTTTTGVTAGTAASSLPPPPPTKKQLNIIHQLSKELEAMVERGENPFRVSAKQAAAWQTRFQLGSHELLRKLTFAVKQLARAPISGFLVGAVGLGQSGAVFLGVNLEFMGMPLSCAVHAEQFLLVNACRAGEPRLVAVATSATPCGHCRQFFKETVGAEQVEFVVDQSLASYRLCQILPLGFGPLDLGNGNNLYFAQAPHRIDAMASKGAGVMATAAATRPSAIDDAECRRLLARACDAFSQAYSPYSKSPSGFSLLCRARADAAPKQTVNVTDGSSMASSAPASTFVVCQGSYVESAAYNPSLSPLSAALIELTMTGLPWDAIVRAQLVEARDAAVSQADHARDLLNAIAPACEFCVAQVAQYTTLPGPLSSTAANNDRIKNKDDDTDDGGDDETPKKRQRRLSLDV